MIQQAGFMSFILSTFHQILLPYMQQGSSKNEVVTKNDPGHADSSHSFKTIKSLSFLPIAYFKYELHVAYQ